MGFPGGRRKRRKSDGFDFTRIPSIERPPTLTVPATQVESLYAHRIHDEHPSPESRVHPVYVGEDTLPLNHFRLKGEANSVFGPVNLNSNDLLLDSMGFWRILLQVWEQRFVEEEIANTYGVTFQPIRNLVSVRVEHVTITLGDHDAAQTYRWDKQKLCGQSKLFRLALAKNPNINWWRLVCGSDILRNQINFWLVYRKIYIWDGDSSDTIGFYKVLIFFARILGLSHLLDCFEKAAQTGWKALRENLPMRLVDVIRAINSGHSTLPPSPQLK